MSLSGFAPDRFGGNRTALDVFEVDVAGYFPSATASPNYQGVFLCAWDGHARSCRRRDPVVVYQPFGGSWIHKVQVKFMAVLLAEVLKSSVGNEWVENP